MSFASLPHAFFFLRILPQFLKRTSPFGQVGFLFGRKVVDPFAPFASSGAIALVKFRQRPDRTLPYR